MKLRIFSLFAILAGFAVAAQAGDLYTDGANNYWRYSNGTVVTLGVHCGDYSGDGSGDIVVYRNCSTNWAVTDSVGLVELGASCYGFPGTVSGAGSVSYWNDGTLWTVYGNGALSPTPGAGGGC
jgi:hypothetical protein